MRILVLIFLGYLIVGVVNLLWMMHVARFWQQMNDFDRYRVRNNIGCGTTTDAIMSWITDNAMYQTLLIIAWPAVVYGYVMGIAEKIMNRKGN